MLTSKQLTGLGISENEGKVYLGALELGPATAQQIARKTGLSRVTTYAMIEALTARGLMSSVEKDNKRLFAAESPERLKSLLKNQKAALDERERELDSFLPELKALAAGAKEKPTVRFYEGIEGLETMRQDLLNFEGVPLVSIQAKDDYYQAVPEESRKRQADALRKKRISVRAIFTYHTPFTPAYSLEGNEIRQVPADKFPFVGELDIYDNHVAMVTYKGKPVGVMIYSKEFAQTMRAFFELAWIGSEQFQEKK